MPTKSRIDAQNLYANILEEIKLRLGNIDHCILGRSGLAPPFVREVCYLQIRMICELVAMGCLVAHGDIKGSDSAKLQREWSAERIMNALEVLHPYFFPTPIKRTRTKGGYHIQAVESSLNKVSFLGLYGKCGGFLHRGNVRKLLRGQFPDEIRYSDMVHLARQIIALLNEHILVMHTGEQMFLAMLSNANDQGRAQVAIVQTPKGLPMDFTSTDFLKGSPPQA